MEQLIAKYRAAQEEVSRLYNELCTATDGFRYVTRLRSYGSVSVSQHTNQFTVQELCDEYTGDDGIVDVYTTNPNHSIESYGDVEVISEDELEAQAKDRGISMSAAICNWISRI